MAWILLIIAGLLEMGWALALKYSDGFTKLWPSILVAVFMSPSVFLLAQAAKTIPIGTSYAVWTGIGAAGVCIAGMILFSEPVTAIRLVCIGGIVLCIAVLKYTA